MIVSLLRLRVRRIRPTFVSTHTHWSWLARFDHDPRFRRDYVALVERRDPINETTVLAGDVVRREAIAGRGEVVERIRRELEARRLEPQ